MGMPAWKREYLQFAARPPYPIKQQTDATFLDISVDVMHLGAVQTLKKHFLIGGLEEGNRLKLDALKVRPDLDTFSPRSIRPTYCPYCQAACYNDDLTRHQGSHVEEMLALIELRMSHEP